MEKTEKSKTEKQATPKQEKQMNNNGLFICGACEKKYISKGNLKKHYGRQPLCLKWIKLTPKVTKVIDVIIKEPKEQEFVNKKEKHPCNACQKVYSSVGNLNKHITNSIICQKWLKYVEMAPLLENIMDSNDQDIQNNKELFEQQIYKTQNKSVNPFNLKDSSSTHIDMCLTKEKLMEQINKVFQKNPNKLISNLRNFEIIYDLKKLTDPKINEMDNPYFIAIPKKEKKWCGDDHKLKPNVMPLIKEFYIDLFQNHHDKFQKIFFDGNNPKNTLIQKMLGKKFNGDVDLNQQVFSTFIPSPPGDEHLFHIIWNVYLTDREADISQELLDRNKIK